MRVYIGVGANLSPEKHIEAAIAALSERVHLTGFSTFYRTKPIGSSGQPDYINGVVQAETSLSPQALKHEVLRPIEAALGRERGPDRFAARTIDLDVLLYGAMVVEEEDLALPDPDVRERPFLAAGLKELDPALRWPGTNERLADWQEVDHGGMRPETDFTKRLKETYLS